MPYEMKAKGMEELSAMLNGMAEASEPAASRAVYKGAGIVADEIKKGAESIRTAPFKFAPEGSTRLPSPEEKAVILAAGGAGIAKFDKNGSEVQTSVGYAKSGYALMAGRVKPIPQIANAINSGTSFMPKQPFVRKAARTGGKKAMEAMKESIVADFEAAMKNKTGGNET